MWDKSVSMLESTPEEHPNHGTSYIDKNMKHMIHDTGCLYVSLQIHKL